LQRQKRKNMFSKSTEYALRATLFIAEKGSENNKLGIDEIAAGIQSPKSFTAKILQLLTGDKGIISSTRGPNGGFYLTEKAKQLPIRAILEVMEQEGLLGKCILGLKKCSEVNPCPMHFEYKPIKKDLKDLFEAKTIQQLVDEMK